MSTQAKETFKLIEECRDALAQELDAWYIDPPLFHVQQAHIRCAAWLLENGKPASTIYCNACERNVDSPCNSWQCSTPEKPARAA